MKASELRLGNWVEQPNDGVTRVTAVLNDLQIKTETGYVDKYCRPIPLTEEWLLKFGFETWETEVSLQIYDFWQLYNLKIAIYKGNFYTDINAKKIFIKHVHQLQNLYFALTSEELTIKL